MEQHRRSVGETRTGHEAARVDRYDCQGRSTARHRPVQAIDKPLVCRHQRAGNAPAHSRTGLARGQRSADHQPSGRPEGRSVRHSVLISAATDHQGTEHQRRSLSQYLGCPACTCRQMAGGKLQRQALLARLRDSARQRALADHQHTAHNRTPFPRGGAPCQSDS